LWAEQYSREVKDIFKLQMEVAKNIAGKIEVIITPEEEKLIEKIPTDDPLAYDHFLKGLEFYHQETREGWEESIVWFKKAIERDDEFALAYANIAVAYYLLDLLQAEKQYETLVDAYADKAFAIDDRLGQSLIAKALSFTNKGEFDQALPYLEKALKYNPNSAQVINLLSDFYSTKVPDTEKYLEYALKGIQLDIGANDSVTTSFIYLHLSNAFIQSGFVDEAEIYINKSLTYNPQNLYSEYLKAYIYLAQTMDFQHTKELLIAALAKDSNRLDIMQEVAKICYFQRDWDCAYQYYKKFTDLKKAWNLDIYRSEDAKIALVYSKMGMTEEAEEFLNAYKIWAENDESTYKHVNMAAYYAYTGDTAAALELLELFAQQDNYFYWIVLFLDIDPFLDNITSLPDFEEIMNELKIKFEERHQRIKAKLEGQGLI
jgi:tetratricopeptide (TPR) repeat protein